MDLDVRSELDVSTDLDLLPGVVIEDLEDLSLDGDSGGDDVATRTYHDM